MSIQNDKERLGCQSRGRPGDAAFSWGRLWRGSLAYADSLSYTDTFTRRDADAFTWRRFVGRAPGRMGCLQIEEHGLRFWYPEGWEQYAPEGIDQEVEFYIGVRDSTVDDFRENILVMVPPYGGMTLSSLVDVLKGPFESMGALVSDRDTTVNGEPGHEWILSWPLQEGFTDAGQKQRLVVLNAKGG